MAGLRQQVTLTREEAKWLARELKVDFHMLSEKRVEKLKKDSLKFQVFDKLFFV
jgi:hypothetical protein